MSTSAAATASGQQQAPNAQLTLNLQELLNNLFLVLTEKEVTVIKKRFALGGQGKQTLEKIGKQFKVTRERIRQIESIALSKLKRTVRTTRLDEVNDLAKTILRMHGGVMREEDLVSQVLKRIQGSSQVDGAILRLSFSIDQEMSSTGRSNTFVPFWRLTSLSAEDISLIVENVVKILRKRKTCMKQEELVSAIQGLNLFKDRLPSQELIVSCLKIDERLREIEDGWGLTEWRFVRPRSIRDKVEIILKKSGEPLHFMEIANRIREARFDHKNVTVQAVHNELIRYPQFVLVGRGLYALKEWGYEPGTVADVIERILKEKGPLSKKEIILEVAKQRTVKVGTISLNLQKMPYFTRVGRAVYAFDPGKK
ncbi:MAG: sigma factor-like helix-turn-helix DNA-binding protein [Candidatus Peregrinibacteria bacterium]|nr:sigma factor-like helix-turn-helix DNA-binding protein [Candidatus Peregrinibacteria bacterium]